MSKLLEQTKPVSASKGATFNLDQRSHLKHELRQRIATALQVAQALTAPECLQEIKTRLLAIQAYCQTMNKPFIFVEERITCDQYDLGCNKPHAATLFRGPSEDASVAICVTDQGSLLYRNSSLWQVYKNGGDIACNIPTSG